MKKSRGFTLIELLVVISIISILSVVGFVSFQNVRKSAQDAKIRADLDAIKKAYETNFVVDATHPQGAYQPLLGSNFVGGKIPTPDGTSNTSYFVIGPDAANPNNNNFLVCGPLKGFTGSCTGELPNQCHCISSSGGSGTAVYSLTDTTNIRKVFVTNASYGGRFSSGGLSGLSVVDNTCQSTADGLSLGGQWKAWVSSSTSSVSSRFTKSNAPYQLLDGTTIANNWSDLVSGTLRHAINLDENGNLISSSAHVWTGTAADGSSTNYNCTNWTSNSSNGSLGDPNVATSNWTALSGNYLCAGSDDHLYCFQQ